MTNLAISAVYNQDSVYCVTVDDRQRNHAVTISTNGLTSADALTCLESLLPQAGTVVVHVSESVRGADKRIYAQEVDAIRRLGKRVSLGFSIGRTEFCAEYLLDLIAETGCRPTIRLSLAPRYPSDITQHIHPNQYRAVAVKVTRFARVAADVGVSLAFDCGFVRCMFSSAELETLRAAGADAGWWCNPMLGVDVTGNVLHCSPTTRLVNLPLAPTLGGDLEARTRPYRQAGVYPECSTCPFKARGECPGGCLATTIRRFRHTPFTLEIPDRER